MKCTGLNCPMQHGYDVENCKLTDCKYRTMPMTNYERIRNMTIEEMTEFISHFSDGYHTPNQNKKRRKEMKKWLESEIEQ